MNSITTKTEALAAVNKSSSAIRHIDDALKTTDVCYAAVSNDGANLKYVPAQLKTPDLCKIAVSNQPNSLEFVPEDLKTPYLCFLAWSKSAYSEEYFPAPENFPRNWLTNFSAIPGNLLTQDICELIISKDPEHFSKIPKKMMVKDLCEKALQKKGELIKHVPPNALDQDLCKIATNSSVRALQDVPANYLVPEVYGSAFSSDQKSLSYIPGANLSPKICTDAVEKNPLALEYVPDKYCDKEMCDAAVNTNPLALKHVPDKYCDQKMCDGAVDKNPLALEHVPKKYCDQKMCDGAVDKNPLALKYVPDFLKTAALCELALKKTNNPKDVFQFIPKNRRHLTHFEISARKFPDLFSLMLPHEMTDSICNLFVSLEPSKISLVPAISRNQGIWEIALRNEKWSKETSYNRPFAKKLIKTRPPVGNCKINWNTGKSANFLFEILDQVESNNTPLYADINDPCVVHLQPEWSLEAADVEQQPIHINQEEDLADCDNWKMEKLAYYVPANFHAQHQNTNKGNLRSYGIHIMLDAAACLSDRIKSDVPQEKAEVINAITLSKLFAHEICHAWIEDLCCFIDHIEGEYTDRYKITQRRYRSYIFMEEAICNSASYGWINHLLLQSSWLQIHKFNSIAILGALYDAMRRAPKGYCDFIPLQELPEENHYFKKNVVRLLNRIYEYPPTITSLHGPEITLEQIVDMFFSGTRTSPDSFFSGIPPVFLH